MAATRSHPDANPLRRCCSRRRGWQCLPGWLRMLARG